MVLGMIMTAMRRSTPSPTSWPRRQASVTYTDLPLICRGPRCRRATDDDVDDFEAIRRLKARYFRTMDTKDWTRCGKVFTDDVVIDTSEAGGGVVRGAGRVHDVPGRKHWRPVTVHQGHMPEIDIISETDRHRDLGAQRHPSSGPTACASTATATITKPTKRAPTGGGSSPRSSPAATDFVMRRRADACRRDPVHDAESTSLHDGAGLHRPPAPGRSPHG